MHDSELSAEERIERRELDDEYGYRDEDVFRELYVHRGWTFDDLADHFDRSLSTISKWCHRHEIEPRDREDLLSAGLPDDYLAEVRRSPATLVDDERGYVRWRVFDRDRKRSVGVHQLVAIANGADPYVVFGGDGAVHHINGIKWDNRPTNLSSLSFADHAALHAERRQHAENGDFLPDGGVVVAAGSESSNENFEFAVPRDGKVNVANLSYGETEAHEHTYTVSVDDRGYETTGCTCPGDEHHPGKCKHRRAVEETPAVRAAAAPDIRDGNDRTLGDDVTDALARSFTLGVDEEGRIHHYYRPADTVVVFTDAGVDHRQHLAGRSLAEWIDFVEQDCGWRRHGQLAGLADHVDAQRLEEVRR